MTNKIQDFKVLQRNAKHFEHNDKNRERMQSALEDAGGFREPIDSGGRSFKPQYGPAKAFARLDSEYVFHPGYRAAVERGESGEDKTTLLKQARPAAPGTGQFQGLLNSDTAKITTLPIGKQALKTEALALENILLKEGQLNVDDLAKRIPSLKRKTQRFTKMTTSNWITKVFANKFEVRDGVVVLKGRPRPSKGGGFPSQAPRPPAKPSQAPFYTAPAPMTQKTKSLFAALMMKAKEDKARLAAAG